MDKLEYIPGDLVMTNGLPLGTAKDVVYIVTSSDPSKTLESDYGTVLKGVVFLENIEGMEIEDKRCLFCDFCAWVDNIVPIPLTPEILEKNGWKRTQIFMDNDGFEFHIYVDDERCLDLQYYPQYKKFSAFICEQEILPDIEYVHQLQHLLFGLGLNHEMNV
nr:MAG TPA: hypothetical protein [Caudoviricetes sp.]